MITQYYQFMTIMVTLNHQIEINDNVTEMKIHSPFMLSVSV